MPPPSITWQKLMDALTLKGYDIQGVQQVKEAKDDNSRFKICYNLNKSFLLEWMNECLDESNAQKSAAESALHRTTGNNFYKKGKDNKSLEFYNKSVVTALYNTEEMALALANRSAVLYRLHHFEEALNDIELALESGYPDDKKDKLSLRKEKILGDYNRDRKIANMVEESENSLIGNTGCKSVDILKYNFNRPEYDLSCNAENDTTKMTPELPKVAEGESSTLKNASVKLELKNSTEKGRYVVTNTNVNVGDVLFVEKPFALIVLPEQTNKHCHHCCKMFVAPIPCAGCTEALYCSNKCRQDSWHFYHKWECGGLSLCYKIGIAHLGLRVALLSVTTTETIKYQQVYNLLTHVEEMTPEDLYQYTLTATLLTIYLKQRTDYFPIPHDEKKIEAMGGLILRHIAQLICNGHAITKIDSTDDIIKCDKIIDESKQRIATAIYPSASMMNHSCNNNILNIFVNDTLIVQASKSIEKGSEVFNCYGPYYTHMDVEERQHILKSQYFFTCKCDECIKPSGDFQLYFALQCTNCEGPVLKNNYNCARCNKRQPIEELMNMSLEALSIAAQGRELSAAGKIIKAIKCFEKSLDLGQKCLFKDNFDLLHYKDNLAKNYAELGDYTKSVLYLEQCLPIIEKRYGSDSIELTKEYFKLIDIRLLQLWNAGDNRESLEYREVFKKSKKLINDITPLIEVNSGVLSPVQKKQFHILKLFLSK